MDTQNKAIGDVKISEDVLASIAAVAAMEVEGVASLTTGLNFNELFGFQYFC